MQPTKSTMSPEAEQEIRYIIDLIDLERDLDEDLRKGSRGNDPHYI